MREAAIRRSAEMEFRMEVLMVLRALGHVMSQNEGDSCAVHVEMKSTKRDKTARTNAREAMDR